ncbi:Uncharacterized protein BP5553_05511 [Venustampulla echinocandica]|uniref:Ig-like domain-containing protein n=1 Tax=Venustampulla echinocandica TaxID=2656787 RepID=A0A370TRF1_9HELO|nr:Uncharacterized protein BP5553_05511 [Venustampulla echinocandica]RDL38078.1 Uncharacterized protein BP5553_05511 [Venustampulla echinocandica]
MGISVILAAAALAVSALAIDVPAAPPTWPSGRCTDKSLTIPSWIITKYTVSGGTTTFTVDNRASEPNGRIGDLQCKSDGECQTSGNDELRGYLSQSPNGPVIKLSEIWVCGDEGGNNNHRVTFTASGSTTITQCSGSDCVSPIPYLVPGTLSLPLPLTPAQPSPPPGYDAASCASVGDNQWTVTDVSYQNYTKGQCKEWYIPEQFCLVQPDTGFKPKGVHLNFKVKNNAIEHEVACSFTPSYEKFLPPSPLRCTGGGFNNITLDVTFTGQAPNFELKVEELWYCLENPKTNVKPTVIAAAGSTSLQLSCSSTPGITGTPDDIVTICTDPNPSHAVKGAQTAKQTLPEFSLVTADPVHGGCTFDSVVNPTFYMRGLFFETNTFPANDPNSVTLNQFTCGLTGPGFADYFFSSSAPPLSGSGINTVYNCNSYGDGQPIHWNCSFSFDPFKKVLTLDKVWQCTDKDAAHPIYFDGSGTFDWNKDPYSSCTTSDTSVRCYWYDDLASLQPGIPYDIPKITTSLTNVAPLDIETVRVNAKWAIPS